MIHHIVRYGSAGLLLVLWGCATDPSASRHEGPVISKSMSGQTPVTDKVTVPTKDVLGPASESSTPAAQPPTPEPTTAASADLEPTDYLIGPGDVLDFRSLDDPTLSSSVSVRYDGLISLPLIPDVVVKERTRAQAEEDVRKAYGSVFRDPQISLTIRESLSKLYYVMGDVSRPSEFPYKRKITLLDAINSAGGLRINQRAGDSFIGQQGQLTKALIIRHVQGERQISEYDLRNLSAPGPHASDTPVYPGDIVYVPEGVNLVYVFGEVHAPGVFQLTEGMRVLDLLVRTGGPNFASAKLRHVVLLRQVDADNTEVLIVDLRHILATGQDLPLKPGDIIYIPRKDLVRAQEFVSRFTGSLAPLMSLYTQAWDTYYTADRYNRLYNNSTTGSNTVQDALNQILNLPQAFSGVTSILKP